MVTTEKIIQYVLYTPHNPNRAVLKSLLESYLTDNGGSSSGSGDSGDSGSGSGTTVTSTAIVTPSTGGTTTISPESPEEGDTVTITPSALAGNTVAAVIVITLSGEVVEVTDNGDGTYSYTQPSEAVITIVDYDTGGVSTDDIIIYDGGTP